MRRVPVEQFRSLLRAYGVDPKPSAEDRQYFELRGNHESRFWVTRRNAQSDLNLMRELLAGMDPWQEAILWPRHERWNFTTSAPIALDIIARGALRAAGLPDHATGALIVSNSEIEQVIAILFVHATFGINTHDDLYFVPDHGQQFLQVDHHDVIHVACRTEKRMDSFVEHMKRRGFLLPTEIPDETFKHPVWMTGDKQNG